MCRESFDRRPTNTSPTVSNSTRTGGGGIGVVFITVEYATIASATPLLLPLGFREPRWSARYFVAPTFCSIMETSRCQKHRPANRRQPDTRGGDGLIRLLSCPSITHTDKRCGQYSESPACKLVSLHRLIILIGTHSH